MQPEELCMEMADKKPKVTCFNYGEWGRFIPNCKPMRLCFICQPVAHIGRDYLEWQKPLECAQYLGSASQGLVFFHVEV
jgi:hypothetical protein